MSELEAWRATAIPDPSASFDADALAGLVRDCYAALGIDADVGAGFSVTEATLQLFSHDPAD